MTSFFKQGRCFSTSKKNGNGVVPLTTKPSINDSVTDGAYSENFSTSSPLPQSILILGSTGQTGAETIRQLGLLENPPHMFGMNPSFKTVSSDIMELHRRHVEVLIEGDATQAVDIHRALLISKADTIIVAIADEQNTHVQRQASDALTQVLRHPPFRNVHMIVVSWAGLSQASSRRLLQPHWGIVGRFLAAKRHRAASLQDHQDQERVLSSDHTIHSRTTIVRPTDFGSKKQSCHRLTSFGTNDPIPNHGTTATTEVEDLARWLVHEAIRGANQGATINVTSVPCHK